MTHFKEILFFSGGNFLRQLRLIYSVTFLIILEGIEYG